MKVVVHGRAVPQGALKAGVRKDGRVFLRHRDTGVREWRAAVTEAVAQRMEGGPPLRGPVGLIVDFYRVRPAGHYGKRGLRPSAPAHPATRPDIDKLLRSILDALQGVAFADDSQVVELHAHKRFADEGAERVEITICELWEGVRNGDLAQPADRESDRRDRGGATGGDEGGRPGEPAEAARALFDGHALGDSTALADEGAVKTATERGGE